MIGMIVPLIMRYSMAFIFLGTRASDGAPQFQASDSDLALPYTV